MSAVGRSTHLPPPPPTPPRGPPQIRSGSRPRTKKQRVSAMTSRKRARSANSETPRTNRGTKQSLSSPGNGGATAKRKNKKTGGASNITAKVDLLTFICRGDDRGGGPTGHISGAFHGPPPCTEHTDTDFVLGAVAGYMNDPGGGPEKGEDLVSRSPRTQSAGRAHRLWGVVLAQIIDGSFRCCSRASRPPPPNRPAGPQQHTRRLEVGAMAQTDGLGWVACGTAHSRLRIHRPARAAQPPRGRLTRPPPMWPTHTHTQADPSAPAAGIVQVGPSDPPKPVVGSGGGGASVGGRNRRSPVSDTSDDETAEAKKRSCGGLGSANRGGWGWWPPCAKAKSAALLWPKRR